MDPQPEPSQQEVAEALQGLQAKIVEFMAAFNAAGPPDIEFQDFPDLVPEASGLCLLNWALTYTSLISNYISCINGNPGDEPAMQACCDAAYTNWVALLSPACIVQA